MPERTGEGLLGLPYPIRSPYEAFIIHDALVGKEDEYHSDDRRTERESRAECYFLGIYARVINQSTRDDCLNDDCCKLYVAVQSLCLAVLIHEDDSKAPEHIESEEEHRNAEVRVGESSCVSVNDTDAVDC